MLIVFSRGLVAVVTCFLLFGIAQIPDGPFIRPHPGMIIFGSQLSLKYFTL